jgi:hypothetical protein
MRIDRIIRDIGKSLAQVLEAFDHNITVRDNFGSEGAPLGSVLTSNGPTEIPTWQAGSSSTPVAVDIDAGDILTGTLLEARLDGPYRGITEIGYLEHLEVDGLIVHNRTLTRNAIVPTEWGAIVAGPYTIASGISLDVAGEMRII